MRRFLFAAALCCVVIAAHAQGNVTRIVVPAKRFMFPPYSFAANYYFPEGGSKPAAKADKK